MNMIQSRPNLDPKKIDDWTLLTYYETYICKDPGKILLNMIFEETRALKM